ncbi:MAG: M48 family metalloprotease [Bacteroidetes bacterium]|jgi:predicted Zn-dependent protease|nr:M48 family metalloprotease [Bacteroidota bacterium]
MKEIKFLKTTSLLALCVLINWQCAYNPVTGKKELNFMSESQELALGKQSDPEIVSFYGSYQDEKMQAFINEKGKEMGKISHRPELDYQFRILDSPVVNAFAVPGGYIYFTRGIMAHFNNEAEFAGVLGHEIGHVTARHSAKQYTSQMALQLGFVLGMVTSKKFRQFSDVAGQGLQLMFLKFGRNHESQSDKLGVEYSTKIGYDAHHMADFFQTLGRMRESSGAEPIPTFMSTHPDPVDRYNTVHRLAAKEQETVDKNALNVNRESYLRMIDGITYGEDPRQGYVENNKFYHPEMKFEFPIPNAWKTVNMPTQVQMAPSNGEAMIILGLAAEKTLNEAKQKILETDSLRVISSRNERVNGLNASIFLADVGKSLKLLTYLIKYNGLIYKFHGMAEPMNYNKYSNSFERTFKNFRKLTDQSKINVKPDRIRIKNAKRSGTLKSVLQSYNMKNDRLEEIALLNGMKLTDQIKTGTMIKVIEK